MKNTEIVFIIDKSGSMINLAGDTIGGFNGFIASQKALEGKATLTTVLFDSEYKTIHNGVDINEVTPMSSTDYVPGGMTAMLDAIGDTINNVQDRHDRLGAEKPEKVLFVITTDGEENSSRKYTKSQIKKMIKHQTNGHGWEFMFLGANMDTVKEAENIGISSSHSHTYDYTDIGTKAVYGTISATACSMRCDGLTSDFDLSTTYAATKNDIAGIANLNSVDAAKVH
jgi:uncharacterized protein YegL